MLDLQTEFYKYLYSDTPNVIHKDYKLLAYLNRIIVSKISGDNREYCESDLFFDEVTKAVKSLANNKTPGPDGLPIEFYKVFWSDIGQLVFQSYKQSFENGKLSPSQGQGIINLIPKKDKDLTELKLWRPLFWTVTIKSWLKL